jgi:hypothetical protein
MKLSINTTAELRVVAPDEKGWYNHSREVVVSGLLDSISVRSKAGKS